MLETHAGNRSFPPPAATACSILVVEDEAAVGTVLELVLRVAGHEVRLVDSVAAARAQLALGGYDLMVLDLQLPDGHGFELLAELGPRPPLPVIVVSSARAEENRPRSLELGASDYLTKPFSSEELIARVQHWTQAALPLPRPL